MTAAIAILGLSSPARAQVFRGTVVEEITLRPVAAAEVLVVDPDGLVLATTVSDDEGRFAVAAPRGGPLRVRVSADRFEVLLTPELGARDGEEIELDLELIPRAIDLPGIEVTVDPLTRARAELASRGVLLDDLGQRFIDEPEIERRFQARDVGDVISARGLPGVRTIRAENLSSGGGAPFLCVAQQRARTAQGLTRCSIVVLDGRVVPLTEAAHIAAHDLKAVVVLRPTEATLVYGTSGGGGALLLFTRSVARSQSR